MSAFKYHVFIHSFGAEMHHFVPKGITEVRLLFITNT